MQIVLHQNQSLKLTMTTELRQAIHLLQYTTYELYQFIQEQHAENPLIELEYNEPYTSEFSSKKLYTPTEDTPHPVDLLANEEGNMIDDLLEQTKWLPISLTEKQVIQYLILNVDEKGFLPVEASDIAADLQIETHKVEKGLQMLQTLEPKGVGTKDIAEYLAVQIEAEYPEETFIAHIIRNHLELLANKKWNALTSLYSIEQKDLQEIYGLLRMLKPFPTYSLIQDSIDYVNPDVIIKENEGEFHVYLNDSYLPEIQFNSDYLPLLQQKNEATSYIRTHYKKYKWLMNSIEQRRSTILKITKVLLEKQQPFFKEGFSALQPLTLLEVAEEIDMHESTVSRATMNKIIQTPKGTFEMRKLFSSKMKKDNGSVASQTKVKWMLKELIDQENKMKPLSDQRIADHLKEKQHIPISRRTVAKYREEMLIESSRQRKELQM